MLSKLTQASIAPSYTSYQWTLMCLVLFMLLPILTILHSSRINIDVTIFVVMFQCKIAAPETIMGFLSQ